MEKKGKFLATEPEKRMEDINFYAEHCWGTIGSAMTTVSRRVGDMSSLEL